MSAETALRDIQHYSLTIDLDNAWMELDPNGRYVLARDVEAALASPESRSLDVAWAEAEAALPGGWRLRGVNDYHPWQAAAEPTPANRVGRGHFGARSVAWLGIRAQGDSPAAALLALAARLREHSEGETRPNPIPHGDTL